MWHNQYSVNYIASSNKPFYVLTFGVQLIWNWFINGMKKHSDVRFCKDFTFYLLGIITIVRSLKRLYLFVPLYSDLVENDCLQCAAVKTHWSEIIVAPHSNFQLYNPAFLAGFIIL